MKRKELTPAQSYLLDAFRVLASLNDGNIADDQLKRLLARPKTLRSAINAAFYKSTNGYAKITDFI